MKRRNALCGRNVERERLLEPTQVHPVGYNTANVSRLLITLEHPPPARTRAHTHTVGKMFLSTEYLSRTR